MEILVRYLAFYVESPWPNYTISAGVCHYSFILIAGTLSRIRYIVIPIAGSKCLAVSTHIVCPIDHSHTGVSKGVCPLDTQTEKVREYVAFTAFPTYYSYVVMVTQTGECRLFTLQFSCGYVFMIISPRNATAFRKKGRWNYWS